MGMTRRYTSTGQGTERDSDGIGRSIGLANGQSRRRFLQTAGVGVAGMTGLAGCLGGGESGPETVRIGVLAPHTGKENPIGNSIARSVELAAEQRNEDGGVLGTDVDVIVEETDGDPQTGKSKYEELTVGESADVTIGLFTSEVLLNLMDSISGQQTVHMTTGAATPEAAEMVAQDYESYKYWFRTGPVNAHYLGTNMVDFAEANFDDMGWDSVYVLSEDYAWTEPIDVVLEEELSDAGVEVVGSNRYAGGTEDFSPIYDQVEASGADAAFVAMAHTGTTAIVQWAKQQRPFEFGGIHVPMQLPSYYSMVEGASRYGVTQDTSTPYAEKTEKTVPYANAFHEEVGMYPVYTGYIAFDAAKNYAAAVEEAGTTDSDAVVDALENMSYTGVAGLTKYYGQDATYPHDVVYDKDAEDGLRPLWHQWQEKDDSGEQVTIYPDEVQRGSYQKPPWI
ncbi:MAG: ABC transporter substrate-binding protein [Halanaeroarchaeum sp.]